MQSLIDPNVIQAYRETHYHVDDVIKLVLQVGLRSELLARLYRDTGATCSAYLTAFNPHGIDVGAIANFEKQQQLTAELQRANLPVFKGVGRHPNQLWPGEPSLLALRVSLDSARDIGNRYQQNAIVWCAADAVPQLVLLR
jgi:hypothetical protein